MEMRDAKWDAKWDENRMAKIDGAAPVGMQRPNVGGGFARKLALNVGRGGESGEGVDRRCSWKA